MRIDHGTTSTRLRTLRSISAFALLLSTGAQQWLIAQSTHYYQVIQGTIPTSYDGISGVAATADNGSIICGQTQGNGLDADAVLMKIDELGNVQWQDVRGASGRDELSNVVTMSDGGSAAIGSTTSFSPTYFYSQMLLVRHDADGDPLWTRTYHSVDREYGTALAEVGSNGLILVGYTETIPFEGDLYVLRIDSVGDVLWSMRYATTWSDLPRRVIVDGDGGYLITGRVIDGPYPRGAFAMKIDSLGGLLWWRGYHLGNTPAHMSVRTIRPVADGYLAYGSLADGPLGSISRSVLMHVDTVGMPQWAKAYSTTPSVYGYGTDMAFIDANDPNAGLVMTGCMGSQAQLHTMATDLDGAVLWSTTHGLSPSTMEFGHALCVNADGGITVGGMMDDTLVPGPGAMFLVRTDAQGENGGCEESPEITVAHVLPLDTLYPVLTAPINVVVNDRVFNDLPDMTPTMGCSVAALPAVTYEEFSLVIAPNPMNANAELRLQGADGRKATLSFVDPLGRDIGPQHWKGPTYNGQTSTWQLERGDLPAGMYVLHITLEDGRMVAERLIME